MTEVEEGKGRSDGDGVTFEVVVFSFLVGVVGGGVGEMGEVLLGWLRQHRSALEVRCSSKARFRIAPREPCLDCGVVLSYVHIMFAYEEFQRGSY